MAYKIEYTKLATRENAAIEAWLEQFYPSTPGKFHKAVVDKYLVFYTVHDKLQLVRVHRVLRGSWNIPRHMR